MAKRLAKDPPASPRSRPGAAPGVAVEPAVAVTPAVAVAVAVTVTVTVAVAVAVVGTGTVTPAVAPAPAGWGVYILRCADGTLYTGCTNHLARRLRAHGKQQVKYTRCRLPVALAYFEVAADRSAALRREAAIKRLTRRAKLALCECAKLC